MGTFCFDQYDHPLLWCEEKKRLVERQNAAESVRAWQRKKAEEQAQKERDKKEYYDLSVSHCPWGRPGGGAPNLDIRKRNITAEGLHPTPSHGTRGSSLPPCHINLGGSGHIRSAADRLYITLKDHPSLSFRNKGHVDIELRYKTDKTDKKPKMQLEKITVTEKPKAKEKKKSADEGWTNKELLKELDQENPQTAPSEKPIKTKQKSSKEPVRKCCPLCSCKCTTATTLTTSESEPTQQVEKITKDKTGKPTDNISKNKEGSSKKPTVEQKEKCVRVRRPTRGGGCHRKSNGSCMAASEGVELVPLLARRRGMHRPVSLSSTDVTKRVECNRSASSYNIEYLKDLKRQISQHVRRLKLAKEQEVELCNRHFQTFEQFWGRPGHGAPRNVKTKLNLDDLLYGVPV
ncbi:uncharacterized protein LOC119646548 isoform X2 [Hermetia illucens]|uniref:uncharacterized protein LOC119646548 isoform X2 n=1 Tax=Hermetia illucens TaxID=343691 RepID=UPI0018CC4EA3|nr:uncharacterized protein LOC119646548 isoform X2 [Hermetia illucens]